jgi:hypothetical protein
MNKLFETLLKNTSKAFCSNSNTLMIKFYYKVYPIQKALLEREDNINSLKEATAKENYLQKEDVRINYIFSEEREENFVKMIVGSSQSPWD